jgi:acyl-CoA thioesterase-1
MRSGITKILFLLFLVAAQPAMATGTARTVLVVGDSLSAGYGLEPGQGWVTLLQSRLSSEGYGYRVVNASISGDTTGGGLHRLPRSLEHHHPDVVIIELGGNDGLRGTPVSVVRANLAAMIELAGKSGARVVLAGMRMPPNYGQKYTDDFAAVYPELARRYRITLIGFMLDGIALDASLMQADGIHPNARGQPRLLDNAWPALKKELDRVAGTKPRRKAVPDTSMLVPGTNPALYAGANTAR